MEPRGTEAMGSDLPRSVTYELASKHPSGNDRWAGLRMLLLVLNLVLVLVHIYFTNQVTSANQQAIDRLAHETDQRSDEIEREQRRVNRCVMGWRDNCQ